MSRAFAPAESTQDQPGDKQARDEFRARLRSMHDSKAGIRASDIVSRNSADRQKHDQQRQD